MKIITFLLLVLFLNNCDSKEKSTIKRTPPPNKGPQVVMQNNSRVVAEVLGSYKEDGNDFLKIKISEIDETNSLHSVAVVNETYNARINYKIDPLGNKTKDSSNSELESLTKLSKGETVKLDISFSTEGGWIINKVLN